uniref:Uncharacterized protein n=1 Tax=Anas platyrhynchos TaxID=8839 RepID=A0A8B9ZFY5_ANAPL
QETPAVCPRWHGVLLKLSGLGCLVLVVLVVVLSHGGCKLCPPSWHKCYYFSENRNDWNTSLENCKALEASLTSIDSLEELVRTGVVFLLTSLLLTPECVCIAGLRCGEVALVRT